jgi:hypothetical protein
MVMALPDTGADLDAIPESYYAQKFGSVPLREGVQPATRHGCRKPDRQSWRF